MLPLLVLLHTGLVVVSCCVLKQPVQALIEGSFGMFEESRLLSFLAAVSILFFEVRTTSPLLRSSCSHRSSDIRSSAPMMLSSK